MVFSYLGQKLLYDAIATAANVINISTETSHDSHNIAHHIIINLTRRQSVTFTIALSSAPFLRAKRNTRNKSNQLIIR